MNIEELLLLPKDFKPATLEQMKQAEKVYNLEKIGKFSTFPLTFSCMIGKQEAIEAK